MKVFVSFLFLLSLGANVWQYRHTTELEEILSMQKATVTKQKHLLDLAGKELTVEKQNSSRTVKSAQGLLDRTEKLMLETDRLAAENAAYRQRFEPSSGPAPASSPEAALTVALPTQVPTPVVIPPPAPTPSPTPANVNAKKKR